MQSVQLRSIHDQLVEEEALLLREIQRLEAEASPNEDGFATELVDRAEQIIMQQNAERYLERALRRLDEVRAAKKRIHDGSYGVCDVCGEDIEVSRLDVLPTTKACIRDAGIAA